MRLAGKHIFSLIIFISLFFVVSTGNSEALTLKDAINLALKENPLLRAYTWSVEAKRENLGIAKGHLYPRFTIEERLLRTDNPTYGFMAKLNQERFAQEDFLIDSLNDPTPISDFQTSFSFEQPLFAPKIHIGIDIAAEELKAKKTDYERKREEVVLSVVRTYLMVQTAGGYLEVARKGLEEANEHRRLAELRYKAGTGLYSDLLRTEVAVKEAEAMVVKAESSLEVARRALGLVLGRTEAIDVTEEKPLLHLNNLNIYLDAASERQDLRALKIRLGNAVKAIKLEESALLPEVGMGGSYQLNDHRRPFGTEGQSYLFMVFLKWNLFDATLSHRIKKAETRVHEVEEYLAGLQKEINFRIHKAYSKVNEKEKNLSLSRAALKEAEEAQRLVRTRYENSIAQMVDLLDTQVMLDRTRAKVVEAENDYLTAIAELYYQSGILLKTLNGT